MSEGFDQVVSLEHDAVVVFAKAAVLGKVKTRLSPELSEEQALALYRAFLADTARTVARYAESSSRPVVKVLAVTGGEVNETDGFQPFVDAGFSILDQGEGDLGARLRRITGQCIEAGATRVVTIGADSPTLHVEHLEFAFSMLGRYDVVLGPSFDGGYYMVGLRDAPEGRAQAHVNIFENIPWSTDSVLTVTWERCKSASLLCELLGFWYDVDTFSDVRQLRFHLLDYLLERNPNLAPDTAALLRAWQEQGVFDLSRKSV